MKTMILITNIPKLSIILLLGLSASVFAQQGYKSQNLTLKQAIAMAKQNNKTVQISNFEQKATIADYNDAKNSIFPVINAGGTYQRFSNLTLYDHGLNDSKSVSKRPSPDGANLGVDVAFNLYTGGRIKAVIEESALRSELATINTKDQVGSIGLQTAVQYLDLVRLYHFKNLIEDQQKRAEARLKNITSFYKNQRVTKSDLLRAELTLSNVLLNKTQNENDIIIANRRLGVLLNSNDARVFFPTDSLLSESINEIKIKAVKSDASSSYLFQKTDLSSKIQSARIKNIRSNFYPTLSLISAYGLNYPNNIFYPPVDQFYSIGFVGARINYSISSIYHNSNKVKAAKERLNGIELQKSWVKDNITEDINALDIKFAEALNRIQVTDKSINQAKVNFEIINTKYLNQLSLLTDLLDADDHYQESKYSNVNAQIGALLIYYRLLYTTGKL